MIVKILLKKGEIDYDVGMSTYVVGNREVAAGASHEQAFNYSNTDDDSGEVSLIARFIENAVSELGGVMGRYLLNKEDMSDNDLSGTFKDYVFNLDMPEKFNKNYTGPIRSASHEYVVNRTLYDWYMRAKPDEAHLYKGLFEKAAEEISSYLNRRTGITRIKPYPAI